jgi:membrane-bound inhibitor of C-type lysozyme
MRPQRSILIVGRAVLAWALLSGCSPDEPSVVAEVPPSTPPEFRPPPQPIEQRAPEPEPRQVQVEANNVQVDRDTALASEAPPPTPAPRRLVFECAGGTTFAVRMRGGDVLDLYPPNTPGGSIPLSVVPSASGVHYRIADIDFFSKGDVATLEMGRERYVDCVANPAASTWEDPEPRTGPVR